MNTIQVDGSSKATIRQELHRVNINQFTTYYDLDYLSKEIIAGWGYYELLLVCKFTEHMASAPNHSKRLRNPS